MQKLWICVRNLVVVIGLLCATSGVVAEEEIHKHMTMRELESVFGHHEEIPEYSVATVSLHQPQRRSLDDRCHLVAHVKLKFEVIRLHLERHSSIIAPNFHMEIHDHNSTEIIPPHELPLPECLYHGVVASEHGGQVAVSNCDGRGMTGLILTKGGIFIIKPLPKRLHDFGNDHIIYLRNESNGPMLANTSGMVPPPLTEDELQHQAGGKVESNDIDNEIEDSGRSKHGRQKRASQKVIEIAVFVDHHMYQNVGKEIKDVDKGIKDIVFCMLNAVQLLYNQAGLDTRFKLVIVKLVIAKSETKDLKHSEEIKTYLTEFCTFQKDKNPKLDSNADHWDHGILLSGLDLYQSEASTKNHKVIGLAWVSGMCRPTYSCTINEGKSFESVFVITHEMGHNLGMHHDGKDNKCSDKTNIMSPTLGPGKTTWSKCSNTYLVSFLKQKVAACLNDNALPAASYNHEKDGRYPGERFTILDQCRKAFGADHKPHTSTKAPFEDICRELWCKKGSSARRAHPALDGSTCNPNGKVCMSGQCISKPSGAKSAPSNREWIEPTTTPKPGFITMVKGTVDKIKNGLKDLFG